MARVPLASLTLTPAGANFGCGASCPTFSGTRQNDGGEMKARTILGGLLLVLGCGPAVWAQRADDAPTTPSNARFGDPTGTARNYLDFHYGLVKSVSDSDLICDKTEFGDDQPFRIDKKTKFIHDGKPSTAGDLKAGDKVWVRVRSDKRTGEMTAVKVISGVFDASPTK
jgi:hypothetical protein